MRWPWSPRAVERRESQPFTDAVVSALAAGAAGTRRAGVAGRLPLEAAAGAVARGLSSARVEGAPATVTAALTPAVLALIGRNLIRRGESVHLIEVERGALALVPAGSWDVAGGWREDDWRYRLDLFGPSGNVTRLAPAGAVHARADIQRIRRDPGMGWGRWAGPRCPARCTQGRWPRSMQTCGRHREQ